MLTGIIIGSILLVILIMWFLSGFIFLRFILHKRKKPLNIFPKTEPKYDFRNDKEWVDSSNGRFLELKLKKKTLKARLVPIEGSHNYLISAHGFKGDYYSHTMMLHKLAKGLNASALLLVLRGDKESSFSYCSLGSKESEDLILWIKELERLDPLCNIYIYGVSMGGATVDFASNKFDSHVKGVISDSGFSRVKDQTRDLVKNKLGGFTPLFMVSVSIWYFLIFHISINKYTDEALKDCKVPFFFIHCKDDTFVNPNNITHHIENYNKNNYYEK